MSAPAGVESIKSILGGLKARNVQVKTFKDLTGDQITLDEASGVSPHDAIFFIKCSNIHVNITVPTTKVSIEACTNSTFTFSAKLLSQTVDISKSIDTSCRFDVPVGTAQLDLNTNLALVFASKSLLTFVAPKDVPMMNSHSSSSFQRSRLGWMP